MSDPGAIVVLVTTASVEDAQRIGRTLVEERLVACANVIPSIRSIYRWEGKLAEDSESLLLLKTWRDRFPDVEARVRALHRYEVPEIIALEVVQGSPQYLDWIFRETAGR